MKVTHGMQSNFGVSAHEGVTGKIYVGKNKKL
jgi:hypothetical protein